MSQGSVYPVKILRVRNETETSTEPDLLVREEPLEIRLGLGPEKDRDQKSVSVTMRTPGQDFDLALGFLYTEGIIRNMEEVSTILYCGNVKRPEEKENVVRVELQPDIMPDLERLERHFYTTSSCGVCGKASLEAIEAQSCAPLPPKEPLIHQDLIHQLPERSKAQQLIFKHTGGLHAATLFDTTGNIRILREDIGRHNAVDKTIGAMLQAGNLPLSDTILLVSGRAGFELVQKAVMAGIPVMVAVGPPSSLAVELAAQFGLTLIGFVRNQRYNVYTHPERIKW